MEIAEWLQPHLLSECPYCGSEIINNERLTDRYCSNPQCPGHMSFKIAALAKRLGVKGVGPAWALDMIRLHNFQYHVEAIPFLVNSPPRVYLYEVGEMAMIKGFQKSWRELCKGKKTMLQVVSPPGVPQVLKDSFTLLYKCEKLCDVTPMKTGKNVYIMMSGSFDGYSSRKDFVTEMNNKYGDTVLLVDVGKRKTGVDFLIKESYTTDHEKSAIAMANGIPIVTPSEMKEMLRRCCSYIIEGG